MLIIFLEYVNVKAFIFPIKTVILGVRQNIILFHINISIVLFALNKKTQTLLQKFSDLSWMILRYILYRYFKCLFIHLPYKTVELYALFYDSKDSEEYCVCLSENYIAAACGSKHLNISSVVSDVI